jgi:dTDP-4-dehydrorhamnose reductase
LRIVVFGGTGMLGGRVVSLFRAAGHEVIAPDPQEVDWARPEIVTVFLRNRSPEGVVNCAAFTDVDACEEPARYVLAWRINGETVGEAARECRSLGVWMIHVSTDYVFDGTLPRPYRETDPPCPVNAYGRTKLEGERRFLDSGVSGWIVRTSWLYGPGGRNFVRTLSGLMRETKRVEVVDDQTGGPTFTADLAAFLLDLAETRPPGGVYHFANEGYVTWHGLADAIRNELRLDACRVVPVTSDRMPRPAARPANSCFDLTKAGTVSRKPIRAWREALKDYLKEDRL